MRWLLKNSLAGIEIGPKALKMAVIERLNSKWRLVHWDSVPLPDDTVKPAFKSPNVLNPEDFISALQRLLDGYQGKIATAGLSLPSEIIRILIREYPKLPEARAETEKLINWSLEKSFHFPIENTRVSYQPTGRDAAGNENLLVTIGMKRVIQQFETLLAGQSVDARVVRPAGI
nr:hypothetical protein [Desulfobacterales bacterium]